MPDIHRVDTLALCKNCGHPGVEHWLPWAEDMGYETTNCLVGGDGTSDPLCLCEWFIDPDDDEEEGA